MKGSRPAPLDLAPPPKARTASIRRSHSQESALPNSAFDLDDEEDQRVSSFRTALRMTGDFLHILACFFLLLIMAFFLSQEPGRVSGRAGPTAVFLIVILAIDIILDFQSIGFWDQGWKGWSLLARLTCGLIYVVVFVAYIGGGGPFPPSYTYWGLPMGFGNPMAYLFLWLLAAWSALHACCNRAHLASSLKEYRRRFRARMAGDRSGEVWQRNFAKRANSQMRRRARMSGDVESQRHSSSSSRGGQGSQEDLVSEKGSAVTPSHSRQGSNVVRKPLPVYGIAL